MAHRRLQQGQTRARAQALQLLFQSEALGRDLDSVLDDSYALSDGPLEDFALRLARGAWRNRSAIDALIDQFSDNWKLENMPRVDKNLLRLAIFELGAHDGVPLGVVISEAVVLAKLFSSEEAASFVNGVLGTLAKTCPDLRESSGFEGSAAPDRAPLEPSEDDLSASSQTPAPADAAPLTKNPQPW